MKKYIYMGWEGVFWDEEIRINEKLVDKISRFISGCINGFILDYFCWVNIYLYRKLLGVISVFR